MGWGWDEVHGAGSCWFRLDETKCRSPSSLARPATNINEIATVSSPGSTMSLCTPRLANICSRFRACRPGRWRAVSLLAGVIGGWLVFGLCPGLAYAAHEISEPQGGTFDHPEEHWGGRYTLIRTGPTVTATFSTTRSPVQHYARQAPTVLFTLPAGYRPGTPVVWEVEGFPVQSDGDPGTSPEPRRFRLQVGPAGTVRYVDDAGVDGVGYLRYTVTLAWPAAGTEPQVCARTPAVRDALLAALTSPSASATRDCGTVTWAELGRIRTLDLGRFRGEGLDFTVQELDLAGLTGLEELHLPLQNRALPAPLLWHAPRLSHLSIQATRLEDLPGSLLAFAPRLSHLRLHVPRVNAWPQAFLASVPLLTGLQLTGGWKSLPPDLLAPVPQLTTFHLESPYLSAWPAELLAPVPSLTDLRLGGSWETLPTALLQHNPRLSRLALDVPQLAQWPTFLLSPTPALSTLSLDVPRLAQLPTALLAPVPQLTTLVLATNRLTNWPAGLLAHTPHLVSLDLRVPHLDSLPPNWLRQPELTRLALEGSWPVLPEALTIGAPNLQSLRLEVFCWVHEDPCTREVPTNFLGPALKLSALELSLEGVRSLPADFLHAAPHLRELELAFLCPREFSSGDRHCKWVLPDGFLGQVPALTHLSLKAESQLSLPSHFLADKPYFQNLILDLFLLSPLPHRPAGFAPGSGIPGLEIPEISAEPAARPARPCAQPAFPESGGRGVLPGHDPAMNLSPGTCWLMPLT